tara:strand:- start:266 stop:811 length:546 start_codon:yes stop_codon:yes gene_type:complete
MGSLEIIMGPMFSGKTELLIEKYNCCVEKFKIAINYYKDVRYGENIISSHNKKSIPSINIEFLSDIFNNPNFIKDTSYIFINEAQFFTDLKDSVIKLIEQYNKHVIICGLDSDYKREKFGHMWDLIPFADNIIKLKGQCNSCSNQSLFTHRITNEKNQEVIGSTNYIPLCRLCYIKNTQND